MDSKKNYYVLAFYHFTFIEHPQEEVAKHHTFFKDRDVKCRIYFSGEGVNGQMSALKEDAESYMDWLHSDPRFKDVEFKIHLHHDQVFPKTTVKTRKQLVALDQEVDIRERGEHVSPKQWRKMLEERDEHTVLLDVRNDYEWEIGHFEGAELPSLEQFRKFPTFAEALKQQHDPKKTKVMMYCTGGIRCELYSALLKKEGYEQVYQLQGGVIKYGLEEGSKHWKGKLFVFDDRLSVPLNENEPTEIISSCRHCNVPTDVYYNCANMDCNELFLCCPSCAEQFLGCCCYECKDAPRLRAYQKSERPKPFRKWPKEFS
jgi:UPF0176 protein